MVTTRASTARVASEGKTRSRKASRRSRSFVVGKPARVQRVTRGLPGNAESTIVPGGRIPPWQSLPYHVLLSIFKFAAYPLMDEQFRRTASVNWLVSSSTVCKAFSEPALSALYESPPVSHYYHLTGLDALLRNTGSNVIEYAKKIHQLNLHIELVKLAKVSEDVQKIVSSLTNLRGLGLYSSHDDPRSTHEVSPKITCDLRALWIKGLEAGNITLKRLHINGYSVSPENGTMSRIMGHTRLSHLAELRLSSMKSSWLDELASRDALRSLIHLRKLGFTRCGFASDDEGTLPLEDGDVQERLSILERIPQGLESLAFIQCGYFGSSELTTVLRLSGMNLKDLELRHNDYLDLRFIAQLGEACPKLAKLCFDLSLFSPLTVSIHHEPDFEEMLTLHDVPQWPSHLEQLELIQLRRWESATAEMFFKSLIDAAPQLPHLRRIHVTASVGAGWRERAKFREEVIGPLHTVFQKPWKEPDPTLRSITKGLKRRSLDVQHGEGDAESKKPRRSARHVEVAEEAPSPQRRSERQRVRPNSLYDEAIAAQAAAASTSDTKAVPASWADSSSKKVSADEGYYYIQGNCSHVYVRVDNLRPAEDQLNEADFLDEEPSGDEAWDPSRGDIDED